MFPTLENRLMSAERELRLIIEGLRKAIDGPITDDMLRFLDLQGPELTKQAIRVRTLRDAKDSTK